MREEDYRHLVRTYQTQDPPNDEITRKLIYNTEYAWIKLADVAPDFWSVREGSFVFLTGETLEAFALQEATDKILTRQEAQQVTFWQDKITQISTIEGILQSLFVGQIPLEASVELQLKLGEAYRTVEHYERAQQCFTEALQISRKTLHDPEREGRALNGLGLIYTNLGHFARAEDCFNRFLNLRQQQDDNKALAVGYNHLGGVFDKRGEPEQAILKSNRLYSLAERPLLLTLMASLHYWRGGSLPEKREELYNDTVDLLLDWWEHPKVVRGADGQVIIAQSSLTELLNVGKDRVRNMLNYLAFQAHSSQSDLVGTADITEQTLKTELMNISQNPDLRPRRLLEYLSNRAGLLVPRGIGIYTFPDRTFQEYLSACYLADQDDYPENVAELARQEPNRWREVLLLAGARASRGTAASIWGLADALCYRKMEHKDTASEDAWGALLAGQALTETANLDRISPRNRTKATRIRQWLVAILTEHAPQSATGEPFPAVERALAGNILAQLGDPRPGAGLQEDGLPDIVWCEVPEGKFTMGSDPKKDPEAYTSEQPQHEVHVSAFAISRYPITNAQYQAFVEDNGYIEKAYWTDEGWEWKEKERINYPRKYGGLFDLLNHPIVGISWYEASAFCQWLTLRLREKGELVENQLIRLPSEAEWEKAARGEDGRIYPWGKSITPELANYGDTGLGATSTVGCFPRGVSPYKCEDMVGNVWEWCQDWFQSAYYAESPERDPQGPDSGKEFHGGGPDRVDRGGSWGDSARGVRCAYRSNYWPHSSHFNTGFRPVRIYS